MKTTDRLLISSALATLSAGTMGVVWGWSGWIVLPTALVLIAAWLALGRLKSTAPLENPRLGLAELERLVVEIPTGPLRARLGVLLLSCRQLLHTTANPQQQYAFSLLDDLKAILRKDGIDQDLIPIVDELIEVFQANRTDLSLSARERLQAGLEVLRLPGTSDPQD